MANLVSEQEMFFTAFEPKMKNRFLFYIDGIPSYIVRAGKRPSFTQDPVVLDHINVQRYVKGKSKWDAIDLTFFDPIVPSGTQAVMEWIRLHHESVTGRDGYAEFYKKDITLSTLGPVGDRVEEWILKGCMITKVNFGDLDWKSAEAMEFSVTIQMDYAVHNF